MADRMTKFLLSGITLLLLALFLRPWFSPAVAQAQPASGSSPCSAPQLVVSGQNIYVLQNGQLKLYNILGDGHGKLTLQLEVSGSVSKP